MKHNPYTLQNPCSFRLSNCNGNILKGFFFFKIFVEPRSNLWGHWLTLFWTSCDPPHGFQSQGGSLTCTLTCLHVVSLRVMSGATPAFSTNRSVHCTSVYTAGPPSTSLMQTVEGRQWWVPTLGSSEIRSRDLILPAPQMNALSTRPRRLA